jgi:hypothetical protein
MKPLDPNDYQEADSPWTLYFQGEAMPKWSNCWMWIGVPDSNMDWYVDQVRGRIDHQGIESEDSEIFIIAAQQTLIAAIDIRDSFASHPPTRPEEDRKIYANLIEGIFKMIAIAETTDVVFWTSGYDRDKENLQEAISKYQLGETHPDFSPPPHRARRRDELLFNLNWSRKKLRKRIQDGKLEKMFRNHLHNLKKIED